MSLFTFMYSRHVSRSIMILYSNLYMLAFDGSMLAFNGSMLIKMRVKNESMTCSSRISSHCGVDLRGIMQEKVRRGSG